MNLVSCGKCGVVLDKDRLLFQDPYHDDGSWDESSGAMAFWDGEEHWTSVVSCPVCNGPIPEKGDL
jgi:hypothetical protein